MASALCVWVGKDKDEQNVAMEQESFLKVHVN